MGELTSNTDSVLISYDDLRKVNAKMVKLKYEEEINDSLRSIIKNDNIIIREQDIRYYNVKEQLVRSEKRSRTKGWAAVIAAVSLVISIITR